MRNEYLKNLNKIEFVITYSCTGRCKHCSEGDHKPNGVSIDPRVAADAVKKIAAKYDIKTVMAFGGEPLLFPESVYAVMNTARDINIPKRQIITNGCFTKDAGRIRETVLRLVDAEVNDVLLSVDAFHEETLSLDTAKLFAKEAAHAGLPVRLQPAWLVSPRDGNKYNVRTREILAKFQDLGLSTNEGNVVFFEGNAKKYLSEYFVGNLPKNPYREDPCNVKCISFEPNGDVLDGNVYKTDIADILKKYMPST